MEETDAEKSQKELDEEIKRKKERQMFLDDVGVVVSMVSITLLALIVVILKVLIFDPSVDPNLPTFRPIDQHKNSVIKYTANGYIPCKGYVPCPPGLEDD